MADKTPAGRTVRSGKDGRAQVVEVTAGEDGQPKRWCEAADEAFFAELAVTCNVSLAAAAAGFSPTAAYYRRARHAAFAAEWDTAMATGYARLEARLVELATDSLRDPPGQDPSGTAKDDEREPESPIGVRMTVAEAIHVLRLHRAAVKGGAPQRYGWRRNAPDADAVRASILRKIDAIERAEARAREAGPGETA